MENITGATLNELEQRGFKARAVSTAHLPQLQEDIDGFVRQGVIDTKLREAYLQFLYAPPEKLAGAGTIFIVAIPQPIIRAAFEWQGTPRDTIIPPTYIGADDARVREALETMLSPAGHGIARARLPVKTLAVRSGLAQYGRNNVTYVPGFGSFHRLVAFYADCDCAVDSWQDKSVMKACEDCTACRDNCPTHCILPDRFLIDAGNCLTWFNEIPDDIPAWVPPTAHNALIGCMRCQDVCPVDKLQMRQVAEGPRFSEEETTLVLQKTPFEKLPEETRRKLAAIAYDGLYSLLARNLGVLLDKGM